MRSPILIAEVPDPWGQGTRFLAPPARGLDLALAAHYVDQTRQTGEDVEEIEGEDSLAVRFRTPDAAADGAIFLILAGIDVDRLSGEERDEILDQLRERAEVLSDAVAALDWQSLAPDAIVELPELDEWHEAAWDLLPRAGLWANGSHIAPPEPTHTDESDELSSGYGGSVESPPDPVPEPEPIPEKPSPLPAEPPAPVRLAQVSAPALEAPKVEPAASLVVPTPPVERLSDPVPDFIVPAAPPKPIDPVQMSTAADRSPSLAAPAIPAPTPIIIQRRSIGWLVLPWAVLIFMVGSAYLYLTQLDRTFSQQVTEATVRRGPTRVVEVIVEKPVEKIVEKPVDRIIEKPVEKIVEKIVPAATPADARPDQWAKFVAEYRARMGRHEATRGAEMLQGWADWLPAWAGQEPPGLAAVRDEYRKTAAGTLRDWAARQGRQDLRFADAHSGVAAFAASAAVRSLLTPATTQDVAARTRAEVREAEDQFHYDRIVSLAAAQPKADDRLNQHLTAYLALHDPPGKMLAEVQKLIEYRDWVAKGRPARATVRITWGPRTLPGEHKIDLTFGPQAKFTRTVTARPDDTWSDTFAVTAGPAHPDGRSPYRIEVVRPTSAVEELAEAAKARTELFAAGKAGPVEAADEPGSGTKVVVDWAGVLTPPTLAPWPVAPVSLPKVGP